MIFTLPTLKDTMLFPSFPARLVSARGKSGERRFVYHVHMEVDIGKCISNDALIMEVEVYRSKPEKALKRKPTKMGSARSFTRSTKRMERNLSFQEHQKRLPMLSVQSSTRTFLINI